MDDISQADAQNHIANALTEGLHNQNIHRSLEITLAKVAIVHALISRGVTVAESVKLAKVYGENLFEG